MRDDIRSGIRQLLKNPGFALVAIATLALGIGAASAMFGLIQGVLLSPPPYADPDRLVLISPARADGQPYTGRATMAQALAWRKARTFEPPATYAWTFSFLIRPDGSQSIGGMVVTSNYFQTLGLKPILGRLLTESEGAWDKVPPTGMLIGHDLWRRAFNSDPNIVGKPVRVARVAQPLPIVGVMPPGVRFLPDPGAAAEPNYDVNAPVDFWIVMRPDESRLNSRPGHLVARLRGAATPAEAQAEAAGLGGAAARDNPDLQGLTTRVASMRDVLNKDGRTLLIPLFGSVALVFFIACANVAGLLLARGLQRHQEYTMRAALGAGRARLFRQVITESLVVALAGAVCGAAVAFGSIAVLKAIGGRAIPRADMVTVGWPVLAFGFLAAVIAAVVAGLLPAARASFSDRFGNVKTGRASAGRGERRLLGAVATLQMILTVALLGGAALLIRTAQNLDAVRAGYETENILAMTVTAVDRARWMDFHTQALARVATVPGVKHAAFAWGLPLTGNKWPAEMHFPGQPGQPGSAPAADKVSMPMRAITQDYFKVMGMTLVEGREFRVSDDNKAPRVVIVNEALVRGYFRGEQPIGRQIFFADDAKRERPMEIVGIVQDTRTEALAERPEPEMYQPLWQAQAFSKHMVIRTAGDPLAIAALIQRELRGVDPTSSVEKVTTMAEIRKESMAATTFAMRLLTGFAGVATLLAVVGLYGVLSLSVGSRTKELAVRKAIGAQSRQIVGLVIGEGSRLIAIGLVLGIVAALMVGRLLESLLFDVAPADPLTLTFAAIAFALVALLACLIPARRAGRVELMEALRQD
jgi:putative ABC transport system permease protein